MTEQVELMITNKDEQSSASAVAAPESMNRKEKRKVAKKEKRKQKRKEVAEKERQEEEARLNDPEEQRRIQLEQEEEKERLERQRREFEERERLFLEELARKRAQEEEEEERNRALLAEEQKVKEQQVGQDTDTNEDEEWEYVEEGPPEIIWQGNEIIVKKNRVRVKRNSTDQQSAKEDQNRPISNPLPPQSEAYADYKNASMMLSAQQLLDNVAQQTPNFGTEQDKAHCPFHLKTGACRFGARCSRVHFYPDKSCTLLIKNMYNGPGLAWEHDEGLEYTEEEVEHSFEEFYEDVHTEFLKFGEIINFKVCRNGSYHLRGNVYVHYKSLESAMLAYQSINGRYFAGKQVNCEFVAVTRWKVAICGEYMKSNLKVCSRGSACNFIHCFRNPGRDYEWADWDKPPPRYWVENMAALFGYSDQFEYDRKIGQETPDQFWGSRKRLTKDRGRYRYRRSRSKEMESSNRNLSDNYEEDNAQRIKIRHTSDDKGKLKVLDGREGREQTRSRRHHRSGRKRSYNSESETDWFDSDRDADMHRNSRSKHLRYQQKEFYDSSSRRPGSSGGYEDTVLCKGTSNERKYRHREEEHIKKSSRQQEELSAIVDNPENKKSSDSTDSSKGESCKDGDSVYCNDHRHGRSYDFDSSSEWSDEITERYHKHKMKSASHSTVVSRLSDDYREPNRILIDSSHEKGSEQIFELCPTQKHSSSCRKDHLRRKSVEAESLGERVSTKSSQYDGRSNSYDSDFSYNSTKRGSRESKKDHGKKSKRKFGSDEKFNYDHTREENHRNGSGGSLEEDVDRRGRWEPKDDSEKRWKHRRKSHSKDDKHHGDEEFDFKNTKEENQKDDSRGSFEDIGRRSRWEPKDDSEKRWKHRRKFHSKDDEHNSDEELDYDHTKEENQKDDSRGEDVDRRGRWKPDDDSEEQWKHRRKSRSKDDKHHGKSGLHYRTSDEYLK